MTKLSIEKIYKVKISLRAENPTVYKLWGSGHILDETFSDYWLNMLWNGSSP